MIFTWKVACLSQDLPMNILESDSAERCLKHICFCREPGLLRPENSFSLTERCLSDDSLKASSGEVSPYDNNSPVLSDRLLCKYPGDNSLISERVPRHSRQSKLHSKDGSGSPSPTFFPDKGEPFPSHPVFKKFIL